MTQYLTCETKKKGKRVAIQICLTKCDVRETCKEFQAHEKPNLPEVVEGEGEKELYERALTIRTSVESSFLELGAVLNTMCLNKYFYGYGSWKDFVEQDGLFDQLRIRLRTADALRAISTKSKELGLTPEDCAKVGYTRLSLLLPVINRDNAKTWMKEAARMKCADLSVKVRQETGRLGKDPPEATETISFKLFRGQKETVVRAFEIAKTLCDSDSRSHCFEMICVSFLTENDHPGMPTERVSVAKNLLKRIETFYGVKVTEAVDKNGEIIPL